MSLQVFVVNIVALINIPKPILLKNVDYQSFINFNNQHKFYCLFNAIKLL